MNPKNTRKSSTKVAPKKKVSSNAKATSPAKENKSKFYVDEKVCVNADKVSIEEPKKLERSNSFYLTRKLSKIYSKLSGSKENLDKVIEAKQLIKSEATPFKFQRSLTLNSIQLKKNYSRTTLPDLRLEKLSEEKLAETEKNKSPLVSPIRSQSPTNYRQSMPPGSFDHVDFLKAPSKLERSDSFISLIRRKISFNETKYLHMSSNWATSLQNLQQIDNMVSYEDLSFVDYDKFNQYEPQIDKMLNRFHTEKPSMTQPSENTNYSVVRRRPKKPIGRSINDFKSNLDEEKNLYRQSIDSNKLRFLSSINFESHRWNQAYDKSPIDWLSLENKPQATNTTL